MQLFTSKVCLIEAKLFICEYQFKTVFFKVLKHPTVVKNCA